MITSFCERDEVIRLNSGGLPPQNTKMGSVQYVNHMPAAEVRRAVPDAWDAYLKFCFERNPWDKVISLYFHRHKVTPRISFDEFLHSGEALDARNAYLYMIDGRLAVDRVCRYERLEEDLADVCRTLSLPMPTDLVRAKSQFRADRRPYRDFLSDHQRDLISRAFADEIELHKYQY